jgi:hypothetical protein
MCPHFGSLLWPLLAFYVYLASRIGMCAHLSTVPAPFLPRARKTALRGRAQAFKVLSVSHKAEAARRRTGTGQTTTSSNSYPVQSYGACFVLAAFQVPRSTHIQTTVPAIQHGGLHAHLSVGTLPTSFSVSHAAGAFNRITCNRAIPSPIHLHAILTPRRVPAPLPISMHRARTHRR